MSNIVDTGAAVSSPAAALSTGTLATPPSSAPSSPPSADEQAPAIPSATATPSPRAELLEQLFALARSAALAGDIEAARVAHDAIGRLLGSSAGEAAPVVDLASARGKRSPR